MSTNNEVNDCLSDAGKFLARSIKFQIYQMSGAWLGETNKETPEPPTPPTPPDPPVPPEPPVEEKNWFYVKNTGTDINNVSFLATTGTQPEIQLQTSKDGLTWGNVMIVSTDLSIPVAPDEKIYMRAKTDSWHGFKFTGVSKIGGNIMSLLYGPDFTDKEEVFPEGSTNTFFKLFKEISTLTDASELVLPATTLTVDCYRSMFEQCTKLEKGPDVLPAETLTENCYRSMFFACGPLEQAPEIRATTAAPSCCRNMFHSCTKLVSTPHLYATDLAESSYDQMFYGCSSLVDVYTSANNISASSCLNNWLKNVAPTGVVHNYGGAVYTPNSVHGIPSGWTEEKVFM